MDGGPRSFRRRIPPAKTTLRVTFVVLILLSGLLFAGNYVTLGVNSVEANASSVTDDNLTVVSDQTGPLRVYGPNETLVYENNDYLRYWDVDPSPVGARTILYTATKWLPGTACDGDKCRRMVVGRLNLTTGVQFRMFERVYPLRGTMQWHDADRVNRTHVAVADIEGDGVFVANTVTDRITWRWNASEHYSRDIGGKEGDWTHLNDVEVLPDGRIMASVRNMDEVVFVRPGKGLIDDWTLGENDNYDVLYEQHNPDYIPESRGGPAVLVADSHNNRIVEYQRVRGEWKQTWEWSDAKMQWPRDADRLPNGHTLVTDSNGDRVVEVNQRGEVIWSISTVKPYEAERLGTGDESSGGESAVALGLASRTGGDATASQGGLTSRLSLGIWQTFSNNAPPFLLNSLLFVLPAWLDPMQVLPLLVTACVLVIWTSTELYWRFRPSPVATIGRTFGTNDD